MAGVTGGDKPRGTRRVRSEALASAATGAAAVAPPTPASAADPAPAVAATNAEVLPDPAVTAQPGEPLPIVTAAPPLAAEPSALDVIEGTAAAIAGPDALTDPEYEAVRLKVLGQTELAIEGDALGAARAASIPAVEEPAPNGGISDGEQLPGATDALGDPLPPVAARRVVVIEVVGPQQGRRRAGFAFGPAPRYFREGELSEEQLRNLRADPMLAVGIASVEVDAFGTPIALGTREGL